ncbi:MAG: DNA-binding response regulator [Deltaproteobacteria bacterium CG_4_8_14_3_um_filter_51_11]|nr:sigma-54-dependent Fis family transcriptional regulator [bacterium]PIP44897.1 MAG: DNA-binding response regulator [Deltaproteobacteria bacterium CG23_combo_of_CG06-09_8_20_14_all_51_20]PIX18781.1 MAG: DNA-binding response regulator [Deltaproteobacteria bacterium CG_4_8_14_3_um_filter_51_11]PIY26909.1 MAG: DNA-binding response regulator [Deltaproteobacteria bacterium CG_4_10_14_3_um_filter_51_14]PJB35304.1 MAG: DNA-binding response regulator [Deltaproteobacteria bacterium CG_4_9_14_3_um_filte
MQTILIVDDEKNYLVLLEALLGAEGYETLTASSAKDALEILRNSDVDLLITDMKMPGMTGMELLEECERLKPDVPVITLTAYGTIEMAVEAMKKHAYDYITKPFQNEQLKLTVKKALEAHRLEKENRLLRQALSDRFRHGMIIGKSKPMIRIYDMIDKVAQSKATVLITGPSGTGKELIAKSIHYGSTRKDGPFVTVNCGALAETLLESELFGHEKGAFTGAIAMKKGRFEMADGGTLFLDEVGDMPASLQVKLLRVLQEMTFERVGGTRTIKVDVRVISATNRDLRKEVSAGNFREDLFYRLNVINLEIPPLCERLDDMPLLVRHFIEKYSGEQDADKIQVSQEVWKVFYNHKWPGNVRELEHIIERALVLKTGQTITADDLPRELRGESADFEVERFIPPDVPLHKALDTIEERLVRRALTHCNNVQAHAAQMLGITKSLMQHKIKKYEIVI